MLKHILFTLTTPILIAACGEASTLNVGDEKAQIGLALTDYAAQWDGYAQAFTFPGDETDRVRVELDEQGNGTIRLGDEALFAAATDPDGWYPPTYLGDDVELGLNLTGVRSGYEFPVTGAIVEDARLKFEFEPQALMEGWCALQVNHSFPSWTCGEGGYAMTFEDPENPVCSYAYGDPIMHQEIPCARIQQCQACTCDATECHANRVQAVRFDAVLSDEGATLTGTLVIPSLNNARVTVVMSQ